MVLNATVHRSNESLKQQSDCVAELRTLVEGLEFDNRPLDAHVVRRGANRMVRLEATILRQHRQLIGYQTATAILKRLGEGI